MPNWHNPFLYDNFMRNISKFVFLCLAIQMPLILSGQHISICFKIESGSNPIVLTFEEGSGIQKINKDTCLSLKAHGILTYSNGFITEKVDLVQDTVIDTRKLPRVVSINEILISETADFKQILLNKSTQLFSLPLFDGNSTARYEEMHKIDSLIKSYGKYAIYFAPNEKKSRVNFHHTQDSIYCSDQYANYLGYINYLHIMQDMFSATRIPKKAWKQGKFTLGLRNDSVALASLKYGDISYEFVLDVITYEIKSITSIKIIRNHEISSGSKVIRFKYFYVFQHIDFNQLNGLAGISSFKIEHWGIARDVKSNRNYFDHKSAYLQFLNSPSFQLLDVLALPKLKALNICRSNSN